MGRNEKIATVIAILLVLYFLFRNKSTPVVTSRIVPGTTRVLPSSTLGLSGVASGLGSLYNLTQPKPISNQQVSQDANTSLFSLTDSSGSGYNTPSQAEIDQSIADYNQTTTALDAIDFNNPTPDISSFDTSES